MTWQAQRNVLGKVKDKKSHSKAQRFQAMLGRIWRTRALAGASRASSCEKGNPPWGKSQHELTSRFLRYQIFNVSYIITLSEN